MLPSHEKVAFGQIVPEFASEAFVHDQAEGLRRLMRMKGRAARVLAVTSGKGGVGKTNLSVNLAIGLAALGKRVVLVDLDLGLANCDIVLDLMPRFNLSHVLSGKRRIEEIMLPAAGGISVVPGASGVEKLANLNEEERKALLTSLASLQEMSDYVIFDTGAGISRNTVAFLAAADEIVVVTTPEPTAVIDAYAVIKMVSREEQYGELRLVINMAQGRSEADRFSEGITETANKILNVYVDKLGYIVRDEAVALAVRRKRPFSILYPHAEATSCVRRIAEGIVRGSRLAAPTERPGFIRRLFSAFRS